MIHKRAIIITEDEQVIFRYDNNNLNGKNFIEKDIFNALKNLDKMKEINIKVLTNMLKAYNGITLSDTIDILKSGIQHKDDWKIIDEHK